MARLTCPGPSKAGNWEKSCIDPPERRQHGRILLLAERVTNPQKRDGPAMNAPCVLMRCASRSLRFPCYDPPSSSDPVKGSATKYAIPVIGYPSGFSLLQHGWRLEVGDSQPLMES
jgi:hypothetical protein